MDLFNPQASVALGYDFTKAFGTRVQVGFSKNAAAANSRQSGGGFYPYSFKSITAFADFVVNVSALAEFDGPFCLKGYAGLGYGRSFDLTDSHHPWQKQYITDPNNVFGFRLGGICEYNFSNGFGVFADLGGEAFTDKFNGLRPTELDHEGREGYAGFPFDLRATLSLGVVCHF